MSPAGELVKYIAKSIVDDPEAVEVTESVSESYITCELSVAQQDMGRVIGKQGRMANTMRILLKVAAVKTGKRVTLEIND